MKNTEERYLTINLTQGTIQVKGSKVVQWKRGSLKKELLNQLKGKLK